MKTLIKLTLTTLLIVAIVFGYQNLMEGYEPNPLHTENSWSTIGGGN